MEIFCWILIRKKKVNYISVVQAVKIWLLLWNTKKWKPTLMISLWKWLWKDFAAVTPVLKSTKAVPMPISWWHALWIRWLLTMRHAWFHGRVEICVMPFPVSAKWWLPFRLKKKQMWWNMYKNARLCGTKNIMCTKLRSALRQSVSNCLQWWFPMKSETIWLMPSMLVRTVCHAWFRPFPIQWRHLPIWLLSLSVAVKRK